MASNSSSVAIPERNLVKPKTASWLPMEVLEIVFGMLDSAKDKGRCARVCRDWRDASYQESVWRDVTFLWWRQGMKSNPTIHDSLKLRKMRQVALKISAEDGDVRLKRVLRKIAKTMPGTTVTELIITDNIHITSWHITDVAHRLTDLDRLDLGEECIALKDGRLAKLVPRQFKKLTRIRLGSCHDVFFFDFIKLCGYDVEEYSLLRLERLELSHCVHVCDKSISFLCAMQTGLKYLSLEYAVRMSDNGLGCVSEMKRLEELKILGRTRISRKGFDHFVATSKARKVWIDGFSNPIDLQLVTD